MYSRLVLTLLLFLLGWLAYQALSRLVLSRRSKGDLLLDEYQPGKSAILSYSSPDCVPCKIIQRPALERLMANLKDDIQLIEIDVSKQPILTDAWGMLSLPTTFIIDSIGQPRGANHGVATEEKLIAQLEKIAAIPQRRLPQRRHRMQRDHE